jgi:hypothetical protein
VKGTVALCRSIGRERKKQVIGKTPQVRSRTNWLEALKNGSRWRIVALKDGRRWRMAGAGELVVQIERYALSRSSIYDF